MKEGTTVINTEELFELKKFKEKVLEGKPLEIVNESCMGFHYTTTYYNIKEIDNLLIEKNHEQQKQLTEQTAELRKCKIEFRQMSIIEFIKYRRK